MHNTYYSSMHNRLARNTTSSSYSVLSRLYIVHNGGMHTRVGLVASIAVVLYY